jgi:hypothetical protein
VAVVHGAEHEIAPVEDQVRVLVPFARTDVGLAERVAVGPPPPPGPLVTVTIACAVADCVPFVQVML